MERALNAAGIPGVALATIVCGETRLHAYGVHDLGRPRRVGDATVFDVASLSKPVAAYIALRLADQGHLDLDRPLSAWVKAGVPDPVAREPITARHLLTHTSGLPNLRGDEPLRVHFAPGSRFSYSSVGFAYLQRALEASTGESLEALARRLVFGPLRMESSGFTWEERFSANIAVRHEGETRLETLRAATAHASHSLRTTAGDYAKFMLAAIDGTELSDDTRRRWTMASVRVPRASAEHLEATPPDVEDAVGWGLGWGVEVSTGAFFQWGKLDGIRAFAMGDRNTRSAVVLLTNSNRGLRVVDAAVETAMPGDHPALAWLQRCVSE